MPKPLTDEELEKEISNGEPCQDEGCLLFETFPVGIHNLVPKPMEDSLLGRLKGGDVTFKLGRGKVKANSVDAAHSLVEREFPQVKQSWPFCLLSYDQIFLLADYDWQAL